MNAYMHTHTHAHARTHNTLYIVAAGSVQLSVTEVDSKGGDKVVRGMYIHTRAYAHAHAHAHARTHNTLCI